MSEKKYVVPEFLLVAAEVAVEGTPQDDSIIRPILEAVILALSENPIVPTPKQMQEVWQSVSGTPTSLKADIMAAMEEWQRRMFLACEHKNVNKYPNFNTALEAVTGEKSQPFMYVCQDCGNQIPAPEQENEAVDPEKERFRVALEKLAKLGNGDTYGNSRGNEIAQEALGMDKRSPKPVAEQDFYHPDPVIETMNRRMAEYSDWVHRNLHNLFDKKPLEPRLDWDKPGRKLFTYGDVMKAGSK